MKIVDVNLLLYATDADSPRYPAARSWLTAVLTDRETVGFAWATLVAYIRISTKTRIFATAQTVDEAFELVDGWLARPNVVVVHPTDRHAAILHELLEDVGTGGNLTSDAHLAALAIEHGAHLCSCDADFSLFRGLRWVDPLRD